MPPLDGGGRMNGPVDTGPCTQTPEARAAYEARWARIIAIAVGRVGSDEIVKSDPDALAWIDHAYSPGAGDAFLDRMNVLRFTTPCEP